MPCWLWRAALALLLVDAASGALVTEQSQTQEQMDALTTSRQ